jgi:polysaccharide deacetylase family protein (PEP-CTERM system associated)
VVGNTLRLLDLLAEHKVMGTFFVLGWVAEQFPQLVKQIRAAGHEIGSHSYWHRLVYQLTPEEFREDLCRSRDMLQNILGEPVTLYRAPSFSITNKSLWALDVLVEEGFRVDSSIFAVHHDRYGIHDADPTPHYRETSAGRLLEFPPSVFPLGRVNLPVGGGGYFRLYPRYLTYAVMRRSLRHGRPFMFYIHPWEIDPQQPRIRGIGWKSHSRHYVNLRRTETKLRWLLQRVRFASVGEVLASAFPPESGEAPAIDPRQLESVG